MSYKFNSDILLGEADRAEARKEFPNVAFALENEALCDVFAPIDERANVSKTRSRRWGVIAVALATIALMLAAAEMLYHDLPKNQVRLIAAIGGVAGIVSVVIGVFGVMFHQKKMRWLADRLSTERIRQFHFQYFVANAKEVLAAAKNPALRDGFREKRNQAFEEFKATFLSDVDHDLHQIVEAEGVGVELMMPFEDQGIAPNEPHLDEYMRAYETLRFQRQIGYCDYVLRDRAGFWKQAPVRQAHILTMIAMACVMGILALHGLVFIGAIANVPWMKGPLVHVIAICAAIVALSARTLEEGFQPEREIERMRQYRLSLRRIYDRFKGSRTPQDKLDTMRDLEKLSYEEMALFLRGNHEAKFVM